MALPKKRQNILGAVDRILGAFIQGAEYAYDVLKAKFGKSAELAHTQGNTELRGQNENLPPSGSPPEELITPKPNISKPPSAKIYNPNKNIPPSAKKPPALPSGLDKQKEIIPDEGLGGVDIATKTPRSFVYAFGWGGNGGGAPHTPPPPPPPPPGEEPTSSPDITPPPAPILDDFFSEVLYTTSTPAQIWGVCSTDTVRILAYFASSTFVHPAPLLGQEVTISSSPNGMESWWNFDTTLAPARNYFYFAAFDLADNTSSLSLPAYFILDKDPPSVPTLNIDNQSGVTSTNINIFLQSMDLLSPIIYFDLDYATNTMNWVQVAAGTTTNEFVFSGVRGQTYYFRARASDYLGNTSIWSSEQSSSTPIFINWSGEVVISEVAWAGTSADYPNHEWFELYNNTDQAIDLSDWQIFVSGKQVSASKINNKFISAYGYYLFERSSDNTIREITADQIYTLAGGFNNKGAKIELLKPDGAKADEADASLGWFAGDTIKYRSMERINLLASGSSPSNWQSNQGFRMVGRSYNGGQIYGSPRQPNFGFISLNYTQEDSVRILTKANSPYVLGYYEIPAGMTLKIEPGVVMKSYYQDAKIDVYGTLDTEGDIGDKIIFTSGRDHSFNSSILNIIVGSWNGADPAAKDWQGFWFHIGSAGTINNSEIRYAGTGFKIGGVVVFQTIRAESANLNIANAKFIYNGSLDVYLGSSSSSITRTTFAYGDRAIESDSSALLLTDLSFHNFSNANGPLYIKNNWPAWRNLEFLDNTLNMPFLENIAITEPLVEIKGTPEILINNLTVGPSSTLNISAGVNIYLPEAGIIWINGSLQAVGSIQSPIRFASLPSSTYWGYIKFSHSHSLLDYVELRKGNLVLHRTPDLDGVLLADNSDLIINNSLVWDARPPGNTIQANNSIINIANSVIGATEKYPNAGIPGVYTLGIKARGGEIHLDNTNFINLIMGLDGGSPAVPLPLLDMQNMSINNFINIDWPWQPAGWWSFPTSTP